MSEKARDSKDQGLTKEERKKNKEISARLREKYKQWGEGKPKKEREYRAIVDAIYKELEVNVSENSVKNHLSGKNESAVSSFLLCWYAEKFKTSVNYLLTGTENASKEGEMPENASVPEVLDALRVILSTFSNQIQLEKYQEMATKYDFPVLDVEEESYYALRINSAVIQEQLANFSLLQTTWKNVSKNTMGKETEERLTELLFLKPLEDSKRKYNAISHTGVFYNKEDAPAFVRWPDAQVSVAVPYVVKGIFERTYKEYYNGYEGRYETEEQPNDYRKCLFDKDSSFSLKDVDENDVDDDLPDDLPF